MRIAAWLSYNGAPFSGFARQNDQLTVQGNIEEALELLFRRPIETTCAGRTDSGVHALCQVISFDLLDDEWARRKPETLLRSLNALTHEDISIRQVHPMQDDFSARFSAVAREYRYFICVDEAAPLLMDKFSWHLQHPLDIARMASASQYLLGEHDFKSFCMAVSAKGKPTNRYVGEISFAQEEIWGSNFVVVRVVGNAFLHSMVRTMVGTLVLVGQGKREPEWVAEVLAAKSRQAAGQNAPAQGLILWNVEYPDGIFHDPRPDQLLGVLAQDSLPADAIEDIATMNLPADAHADTIDWSMTDLSGRSAQPTGTGEPSESFVGDSGLSVKSNKKANKKKTKRAKDLDVQSSASARARRRAEKAKAREFVIPRGPDLSASPTAQLPNVGASLRSASSADLPVASYSGRAFSASSAKKVPSTTEMATGQVSLEFLVPSIQEDKKAIEQEPAQDTTVLSAAAARAHRRARIALREDALKEAASLIEDPTEVSDSSADIADEDVN